jgi:hypothetical protein
MCIDDDEILSKTFVDDDLLSLLEPYIFSSIFQRIFALSSKPYSILIMPSTSTSTSTSTLKTLNKSLDAWASRYRHFSYA